MEEETCLKKLKAHFGARLSKFSSIFKNYTGDSLCAVYYVLVTIINEVLALLSGEK